MPGEKENAEAKKKEADQKWDQYEQDKEEAKAWDEKAKKDQDEADKAEAAAGIDRPFDPEIQKHAQEEAEKKKQNAEWTKKKAEEANQKAEASQKAAEQASKEAEQAAQEAKEAPAEVDKQRENQFNEAMAAAREKLGPEFQTLEMDIAAPDAGCNLDTAGNYVINTGQKWKIKIGEDELKLIVGSVIQKILGDKKVLIAGNKKEVIGGTNSQTVVGASNVTVNGSASWKVSATLFEFTASAKTSITAAAEAKISIGASLTLGAAATATISGGVNLQVSKAVTFEARSGPTYKMTPLNGLKASNMVQTFASGAVSLGKYIFKGGKIDNNVGKWSTQSSSATLAGTGSVSIEGGDVSIKGGGVTIHPRVDTKTAVHVGGALTVKRKCTIEGALKAPNLKDSG